MVGTKGVVGSMSWMWRAFFVSIAFFVCTHLNNIVTYFFFTTNPKLNSVYYFFSVCVCVRETLFQPAAEMPFK